MFALKRARQDRRFKNRELSLMRSQALRRHPNIIRCSHAWQERNDPRDSNQITLYLLLEYFPTNLYSHYRTWPKRHYAFPEFLCKIYLFQVSSFVSVYRASTSLTKSWRISSIDTSFCAQSHGVMPSVSVIGTSNLKTFSSVRE